ncbi:hypothetical protein CUMW_284710 [Citrus unshiu]|uniref:Uncharacterized protein n=1 Tax=Citrus unshiu TaxID=55188 RepID=A0A2H5N555_CITUN|nr:hypothetical protein CUMW_284710 [Citrus unshiu]
MAGKPLMHAVQYNSYGGGAADLKHVELSVPTPSKDEVLLKLEATALNPVDWKVQKGQLRPFLPRKFPCIPGILVLPLIFCELESFNNFCPSRTFDVYDS